MKTLCINTATPEVSIAFDGRIRSWISEKNESEKLLHQIDQILDHQKPEQILIITGPGNFTSLRIGISIANALAYGYGIKIIPCNTFEFYQAQMSENAPITMTAGHHYFYCEGNKIQTLNQEELEKNLVDQKSVLCLDRGVETLCSSEQIISHDTLKKPLEAFEKLLQIKRDSTPLVEPTYFREPHITPAKFKVGP